MKTGGPCLISATRTVVKTVAREVQHNNDHYQNTDDREENFDS